MVDSDSDRPRRLRIRDLAKRYLAARMDEKNAGSLKSDLGRAILSMMGEIVFAGERTLRFRKTGVQVTIAERETSTYDYARMEEILKRAGQEAWRACSRRQIDPRALDVFLGTTDDEALVKELMSCARVTITDYPVITKLDPESTSE